MKHCLSVLVENKPGALTRITTMFARRGFNIDSLAVGPTERHDISRITLTVDADEHSLSQIQKQMHKLVNVLRITELPPGERLGSDALVFEICATPEEVDAFEELVRPHGIKEVVRTGRIALGRASTASSPRTQLVLH